MYLSSKNELSSYPSCLWDCKEVCNVISTVACKPDCWGGLAWLEAVWVCGQEHELCPVDRSSHSASALVWPCLGKVLLLSLGFLVFRVEVIAACRVVGRINEKMYGACSAQPLAPFRHWKVTGKYCIKEKKTLEMESSFFLQLY